MIGDCIKHLGGESVHVHRADERDRAIILNATLLKGINAFDVQIMQVVFSKQLDIMVMNLSDGFPTQMLIKVRPVGRLLHDMAGDKAGTTERVKQSLDGIDQ